MKGTEKIRLFKEGTIKNLFCCLPQNVYMVVFFFFFNRTLFFARGFHGGSEGKASACNAGDLGSIPGLGRSPREGNGNPLQYHCWENPMDGEAWWAPVHGVTESQTRLSDFTFTFTAILPPL